MNSSCSAVSTAPGRTERTLAIASMPSGAQPVSMRSIDATVPARPRPPLQCTTILLPDKSSAANWGPVDCHGRSSRASGAAPSLIGRPCHIKPCALARSAKEVIRSSSNSHGSINVIRCCAPRDYRRQIDIQVSGPRPRHCDVLIFSRCKGNADRTAIHADRQRRNLQWMRITCSAHLRSPKSMALLGEKRTLRPFNLKVQR